MSAAGGSPGPWARRVRPPRAAPQDPPARRPRALCVCVWQQQLGLSASTAVPVGPQDPGAAGGARDRGGMCPPGGITAEPRDPPGINRLSDRMGVGAAGPLWAGEKATRWGGRPGAWCVPLPARQKGQDGAPGRCHPVAAPEGGHPSPPGTPHCGQGVGAGPGSPLFLAAGGGERASFCWQAGIAFLFPSQISRRPDPAVPRQQPPAPELLSRWLEQQRPLCQERGRARRCRQVSLHGQPRCPPKWVRGMMLFG